jgi:prepilin-type processing-associated H-X9-DG protein
VPSLSGLYAGSAATAVGLLLPAVDKVRNAAARTATSNNLRQIGLAIHSYADVNGSKLPMPAWTQKPGQQPKPGGLSWRVHLLPYLEQQQLYNQFHLDEPWDSPHNIALVDRMPKVYASPNAVAAPGQTYYKMCTGPAAIFNSPVKYTIGNIPDGTSNTIFVVEGGNTVTWTKPDDFVISENKPLPDMKLNGNSRVNVLLGDGSVRSIDLNTLSEKTLRNAICPDDGNVLGSDW